MHPVILRPRGGGGSGGDVTVVAPLGSEPSATSVSVVIASDQSPVPISGSITATNPSIGATGSAAPTSATEIGVISSGGNLEGASASNPVRVDTTGTTVQPVSGTVAVSNFPATQPVSGVVVAEIEGHAGAMLDSAAGTPNSQALTIQGNASGITVPVSQTSLPSDLVVVGTIAANAANVTIATNGANGVVFNVTGTWSGTLQPQYQLPDSSWVSGSVFPALPSGLSASTITANGQFKTDVGGFKAFRLLSIAWASGTATVNLEASIESTFTTALIKGSSGAVLDGTAGTPSAGVLTVQGVAGGTALPTEASQTAESTATWTSATTVNTALTLTVQGYTTVVVTLNQGSTITGGVVTFEASDTTAFTNSYSVLGASPVLSAAALNATYTLVASTNTSLMFNVNGYASFRVRLSTAISGTATVNVGITASQGSTGYLNTVNNVNTIAVVSVVSKAGIISTAAGAAQADNDLKANTINDANSVANPLYVGDSLYGGAFSGTANAALQGWSKARTPTIFKTIQATASGNTAIWTPGTGNRFRLLKFRIEVTDNGSLGTAGVLTISFQDATTGMPLAVDIYLPVAAVTAPIGAAYDSGWIDLGVFGILSAAANNVLNVNLSATITSGNARIMVAGTEE